MALIGSENSERFSPRLLNHLTIRIRTWLADRGDRSLAQRVAGTAFLIRVASAGLAFLSQVLLARWMGGFEFGIYVYVCTWLMLIGGLVDLGLASSSQRIIPEYSGRGDFAHLRGFISGSRWLAFAIACLVAIAGASGVWLLQPWLDDYAVIPLYLACAALPIHGVMHTQDGIARSYNWMNLALLPHYIVRQLILILLMGAAYLSRLATNAVIAVVISAISIWIATIGQTYFLDRRLDREIPSRERTYEICRWLSMSIPMFVVDGLYLMLMYVDVLVLNQFVPPEEVAIYYAAGKTLSFVAFVYFAVAAAAAHKFTEYHVAGDHVRLSDFVADAARWTFWPSLAATIVILACGWPLLWLFGAQFVRGYDLMFILAIGLLARAAIGPGERFLNMLGEQRICALIACLAFVVNLTLCLFLIPRFGVRGAAIALSLALMLESVLIFIAAKRRLGFHLFVWGRPR